LSRNTGKGRNREKAEEPPLRARVAALFELPQEIVLDLPLISVIGQSELRVENYKSLLEYSDTHIRVNTGSGVLKIEGRKLTLKQLTSESVTVTGVLVNFGYI